MQEKLQARTTRQFLPVQIPQGLDSAAPATHKLNHLSNNKFLHIISSEMYFTMASEISENKPELIKTATLNQWNHDDIIKECISCEEGDEEISFPTAFDFLEDECHSKSNYCTEWLEPSSSTMHDEEFEEASSLPYEVHQSSICEENSKNEGKNILSSPSSVTSHRLYYNPYLHILNMKEAFKDFKFLLPIMRTEFNYTTEHEPSQHDLKIAKQRLASVVLFHGGNLERSKENIGTRHGKIRTQRKPSTLLPRLKATASSDPLQKTIKPCKNTENYKILQESSSDTTTTIEADTSVDVKIHEAKDECIKRSSAVVNEVTKDNVGYDNEKLKFESAKKSATNETTTKDPDDTNRKRSMDEGEAEVTDRCESPGNGTEQDGILPTKKKTKTTYHCKICGLPKQKHQCIHFQYLERSMGVMTYPFVDILLSDEMGSLSDPSILQTSANEGALLEHKTLSTKAFKSVGSQTTHDEADLGELRRMLYNTSHVRKQRILAVGKTAEFNSPCFYEHISVSPNERSMLSRKLFMEAINVPYLTEECSLVLQQAQQVNMWDHAVAEIFAQVLTITHCPLGDDSLQGLRKYMLTVHGIAC